MVKIQKKRQQSAKDKLERARAATERARQRLARTEGVEVDIAHMPLSWWRERWADKNIRRQFIENFIYVRDAFDKNKLVLMKLNDVQADLHEKVTGRDVVLKSRRQGLSRYWLATYLSNAVVNPGRNVRLVPHDPQTEEEFRADLRMMYEHLPEHLKPLTKYYSKVEIVFHDEAKGTVDSTLKTASVQPGHEGKGRGQTLTDLLLTEPPFWRGDPKKAATSLIEASAGGCVTVESTAFGIEWFHSVYQDGKSGRGGWTSHFYQWWWKRDYRIEGFRIVHVQGAWLLISPGESIASYAKLPGEEAGAGAQAAAQLRFDEATLTKRERLVARLILRHLRKKNYAPAGSKWHCDEVAAYIGWRRSKIGELPSGENQFLVEYPENDRDCFEQTGRPVISAQFLKVTCRASEPVEGREYAIGCDTSLGLESGDPSAIEIVEVHSGRQVHEEILKTPPDLLAYRLAELSDLYNGALIVVERNNSGIATLRKLLELGYEERVYRHLDSRLRRQIEDAKISIEEAMAQAQHGFPTTQESKPLAAMTLEEGVRKGWLGISSQAFCDEAKTVVWFDNGSYGALSGYHDDRFMALAIVWYVTRTTMGLFTGFVGVLPEAGHAR